MDSARRDDALEGALLRPGDPGYDEARTIWNGRHDRRPALIARCRTEADVAASVRHAAEHGLVLSVRGGGHHTSCDAVCDGGLMIDLSPLDAIDVDPEGRTVRIGAGVRARELNAATQRHGLAVTAAPITTCGMAGYTLGGGLGWISRKVGLASDNLLSARVVTADGRTVEASEDEHPDLFWALRGGSGNFGVVTEFVFRLHPVGPEVLTGQIVYAMHGAPEALRFFRDYMADAPDALSCMPVWFPLPPIPGLPEDAVGDTVLAIVPLYDGDPEEGRRLIQPFREVGSPMLDTIGPAVYADLLLELDEMYRPGDRNCYQTAFFDELSDDAIDTFCRLVDPLPTARSSAFLEYLEGAIARRPDDATAYPHRARRMCLTAVPKWEDAGRDEEMFAWAERLFEAMRPFAAPGAYVNYLDRTEEGGRGTASDTAGPGGGTGEDAPATRDAGEASRAAYGDHYERLARIKRRWDPDNLFRMNHNIAPA